MVDTEGIDVVYMLFLFILVVPHEGGTLSSGVNKIGGGGGKGTGDFVFPVAVFEPGRC